MKPPPILYVEDEENDVVFMRRAFASTGIANPLHVARDGAEALAYLKAASQNGEKPCLLLLDLNLPLFSGFEVLQWMRASSDFQSTPVCVLSSSDQPSDMEHAKKQGADDYRVKPSSPSQLGSLLDSIRKRWPLESGMKGQSPST
jgi:CheY-like chemotaxis protein